MLGAQPLKHPGRLPLRRRRAPASRAPAHRPRAQRTGERDFTPRYSEAAVGFEGVFPSAAPWRTTDPRRATSVRRERSPIHGEGANDVGRGVPLAPSKDREMNDQFQERAEGSRRKVVLQ
jgi:hypothetical protein